MSTESAANTTELVSPSEIGHWGVRTTPDRYDALVQWHLDFFGGRKVYSGPRATMISYDNEHHREVIVQDPAFEPPKDRRKVGGIYHIAFTLTTLSELATSYEQKKAKGILPSWPVNHGMTTSMYYFDPDGNEFELQVNNFDSTSEVVEFMQSAEYEQNPIGVDLVVEDWIKELRSGIDEKELKKRPIIGKRQTRFENSIYFKLNHTDDYTKTGLEAVPS
ncbi:hypothetical protein LTR09_012198 [Extremus antarcticus]|uniref:VOC domain-containing protein n=1 Tax=Extremus antarcticus TaxID=702011 RepID=A0AAJ0G4J7_9PEZI|nr:hypothetical protein LTR09_012198 [Extremus antarcticus]